MDTWLCNSGFAGNPILNIGYCADTTSRVDFIDSHGSSISPLPASKGIKRKSSLIDDQQCHLPLSLGLGDFSSSSDSTTACTTLISAKETKYESSMDLQLDFSLHLNTHSPKIPAALKVKPKIDLELSLSSWPSESNITTCHPTSDPPQVEISLNPIRPTRVNIQNNHTRICKVDGCEKGARGGSGCCIAHGGGRRCMKPGCAKGAEGRTVFCKAHGGGRRCEFLGCTKSAEGRTDYCIGHGGGRRCTHQGCTRAARGKCGLCIRHGGGKRCQKENCNKSAEGVSGLCISHGGGRRCQFQACTKAAQGSTMFCKAHGGGKRCILEGCTKGAEGSTPFCKGHGGGRRCGFEGGAVCPKSVHGGTLYCVAHGGGKRCAVAECTKGARGRTNFCVRHGGGKRCKFDGCDKSAQGSTEFCKAHGGGKRCSLVQDKRVYDGATIGIMVHDLDPYKPGKVKENTGCEDSILNIMTLGGDFAVFGLERSCIEGNLLSDLERRVHGGSLGALLSSKQTTHGAPQNRGVILALNERI